MLPYNRLPLRTSQNINLAADVNLLQSNIDALVGSVFNPITSLLDLYNVNIITATRLTNIEVALPVGVAPNKLFKYDGIINTWTTVGEYLGSLFDITTIAMTDQLTNLVSTGTSPFIINSKTLVNNLNVQYLGGKQLSEITPSFIGAVPVSDKGIPNGVATLDNSGLIPVAQIPAIAITDTFVVGSEAAMLALSSAQKGDMAIRTDISSTFVLSADPFSLLSNWKKLLFPSVSTLAGLSDVNLTGLVDGDIIRYNSGTGYFIASTAPTEAPNDGNFYARKNLIWQSVGGTYTAGNGLNLIGNQFSVKLTSTGYLYFTSTGAVELINDSTHRFVTDVDISIWNSKQSALTFGNLTTSTGLLTTNGTGAVIGSGASINIASGYHLPTNTEKATWDTVTGKENTFVHGNLTASIGLSISSGTGAVIGSGTSISIDSGYYLPTTTDETNWNDAFSKEHVHSNISNLSTINQNLSITDNVTFNSITTSTGLTGNLTFNNNLSNPSYTEGKTFYDQNTHALSYYNDISALTITIGQETLVRVKNTTGSTLTKGTVAYASGTTGTELLIDKANASSKIKSRLIGVVTSDIISGNAGYVTKLGEVSGLDTSSFSSGDVLYLSTTDGLYTKTKPTGSAFIVQIGTIKIINAVAGSILVDLETSNYSVEAISTNGFSNIDLATIAFTDSSPARTLTITATGSLYTFYQSGEQYKLASDSIQIPNSEGLYVIYYNLGTLAYIQNPTSSQMYTLYRTNPVVGYVYWDVTNSKSQYLGVEMHKVGMNSVTHSYLHFNFGARWVYGIALNTMSVDGNGTSNNQAQFGVDIGSIVEEDLYFPTASISSTTGLTVYYLSGTSASPTLRSNTQAGYSVLNTGSGRIAYNLLTGGNWTLAEVPNNDFVCYHIFAFNANDINKRIVSIMGQTAYTSIGNARVGAQTELNNLITIGFLNEEVKSIATIIYQTANSNSNAVKGVIRSYSSTQNYVDWRNVQALGISAGSGSGLSSVFNDNVFRVYNNADVSKLIAFDASNISPATTRTFSVPDNSGTLIISEGVTDIQTIRGGTSTSGSLNLYNNATDNQGLQIQNDGTISTNVASYEALVISDNIIPNRKFITDSYQTKLVNSAGLLAALSDETGTGFAVFNNAPTLITPVITNIGTTTTVLHGNASGNATFGSIVENDLFLSNVTTGNVSISQHGFVPILNGNNNTYFTGAGNFASATAITAVGGYISQTFTGQTSVTITHNFGQYPLVQVLDNSGSPALEWSLTITHGSVNAFTVTFSSSNSGTIIASMGSPLVPNLTTVSTDYAILTTDNIILTTAINITLTVPTAIGTQGKIYTVDNSSTGNNFLIGTSSQTIGGLLTQTLPSDSAIDLYSTGAVWRFK